MARPADRVSAKRMMKLCSAEAARTQAATAVAAPAPGGDRGHPDCEGDSGRNGHYCTVPQVVRVSPGRENGTSRSPFLANKFRFGKFNFGAV